MSKKRSSAATAPRAALPAAGETRGRPWLAALVLAAVTVLAYLPAARGGFVWDDDYYAGNPVLTRADALSTIWTFRPTAGTTYYREFPLVYTTFWLERRLWSPGPTGNHVDNILLHALNAILVWLLLKRLGLRGAWLAGAVFALHPVHVESVAWISERKNVLSGLFFLLAFGAYLRFEAQEGRRWYWGAMGLFLLALFSKSVTCTLPVALLIARWKRGLKIGWREALDLAPFFALALGWGLFTIWVETNVLVSQKTAISLSLAQHVLLAGRALWFYPLKLAWPASLAFSYERWTLDPRDWAQWLWPAAALAAAVWIGRTRERWGRGLAAAAAYYAATIAPMLGFVGLYTFRFTYVADHYQYLASVGPIALAVGGAQRLFGWDSEAESPGQFLSRRPLAAVLAAAALVALGLATWRQAGVYADSDHVWLDTIAKNPSCWLAHNNLGVSLDQHGRAGDAVREFVTALRLNPDYADAHNNYGYVLARDGRLAEAEAEYRRALEINPDYAEAHNNLGLVLSRAGKPAEAVAEFRESIRINPHYTYAHNNLGATLAGQGDLEGAVDEYRAALAINPHLPSAHNNLGIALAGQGKFAEGLAEFRSALAINPRYAEAHDNAALVLIKEGKREEAADECRQALRINPNDASAQRYLRSLSGGR